MSFEYSFSSKLVGVFAFRVVSVSIAFVRVAKQASQTVSIAFLKRCTPRCSVEKCISKDSDDTLGSFSGEFCIQFRLEIRWKHKEKVAKIILFCGCQKLH